MLEYKGKQPFKFADVEDSGFEVTVTILRGHPNLNSHYKRPLTKRNAPGKSDKCLMR